MHLETYDEVVRMMMRFSMAIENVTIDLFSGLKENNEVNNNFSFSEFRSDILVTLWFFIQIPQKKIIKLLYCYIVILNFSIS